MNLKELALQDVDDVFFDTDDFADVGTFTQFATGQTFSDVPFIKNDSGINSADFGVANDFTLSIPVNSIPAPVRNDKIANNSVVYTILKKLSADDGVYVVSAETSERHNPK